MLYRIFLIFQIVNVYIAMIFLFYYLIRRFYPSNNEMSIDKIYAIFWPITCIMLFLWLVTELVIILIKSFNKLLDNIDNLVSKIKDNQENNKTIYNKRKGKFLKRFPRVNSKDNLNGYAAHIGDIVATETFLDIGIVASVTTEGVPNKILSVYSMYNNDNPYHCPAYGGIEYGTWYYTGLQMTIYQWSVLTKKLYEQNLNYTDVYKYFANELQYPIKGINYDQK